MKSTLTYLGETRPSSRSYIDRFSQNYRNLNFQSSGGPTHRPASFRSISNSFSRAEQLRHFLVEIAMFLIIALSAGAGLYASALALTEFIATQ